MKRLLRIVKRMLDGDEFYSTRSPRITMSEFLKIDKLGFRVQAELPHQTGGAIYYLLSGFKKENRKLYEKLKQQEAD